MQRQQNYATIIPVILLVIILQLSQKIMVSAFSVITTTTASARSVTRLASSRIEGNQREPTEQDIQVMDQMIEKLIAAKPYELPNAVQRAFRVIRSPQFFLRIAQLTDQATDKDLKERYNVLAQNLVSTLDAVVSTAQDTLDDCADAVESIVKAASEPDTGEFLVPLSPERIAAMKAALVDFDENDGSGVSNDEGFLSTIDAWMNKAHLDGMDGMVGILQNLLQMYAARRIQQTLTTEPSPLFSKLLHTMPTEWAATIRSDRDNSSLVPEIQRNMESLVLSLETGSIRQKVQAEYLQEMVKVAETATQ